MCTLQHGKRIQYKDLHKHLRHAREAKIRAIANRMGWVLTGKDTCEHCSVSKAKQKSVPLEATNPSNIAGERLGMNISSIKVKSLGGAKFWLLIVDECMKIMW